MQNLTAPEIVGLLLLALGALTGFFALMGVSSGYSNNPIVNVLVFIANSYCPALPETMERESTSISPVE